MSAKRAARMSRNQQEVYVRFLEEHQNFSLGIFTRDYTTNEKEKDFGNLVEMLNTTSGAVKDKKQWHEALSDWRSKLMKRYRYHFSADGPKFISEKRILNLKRFDDLDARAVKALGKWDDSSNGPAHIPVPLGLLMKTRKRFRTTKEKETSDEDEESEDNEENDELDDADASQNNFDCVNVKREAEYDDPLVNEVQMPEQQSERPKAKKSRTSVRNNEEFEEPERAGRNEKVIEENTKAIKQHTAALMGLTDSLNALTSTIRSYMYNK